MDKVINEVRSKFFELSHSPFAIFDKHLNLVDLNEAARAVVGLEKTEIVGKYWGDIDTSPTFKNHVEAYKNVLKTGQSLSLENVSSVVSGKDYIFQMTVFLLEDYLGVLTLDTTSVNSALKKQEQTSNDLKQKNKELEDFSYLVAHDLKAPVTNLESLVRLIQNKPTSTDKYKIVVDKIKLSIDALQQKLYAINQILSLKSSINSYKEKLQFVDVVNKVKNEINWQIAANNTTIEVDFSAAPGINYNNIQLHSIFQNLISNALKYRSLDRPLKISIVSMKDKERTVIEITDNGVGFNQKSGSAKVFGLFKRMHTHVEGLGIGLYIVKSILIENGGKIEVFSEINKGTTFKIYFV